jgi:hypothetical protein
MKKPKLIIDLTDNGAVLTIKDHLDFSESGETKLVYEFDEDNKEKLVDLLYQVDQFCMFGEGKYSKERAEIRLIHGEKYDCKDKGCKICHEEVE